MTDDPISSDDDGDQFSGFTVKYEDDRVVEIIVVSARYRTLEGVSAKTSSNQFLKGEITSLAGENSDLLRVSVRLLLHLNFEDGRTERLYKNYLLGPDQSWAEVDSRFDLKLLLSANGYQRSQSNSISPNAEGLTDTLKQIRTNAEAETRSKREKLTSLRVREIGYAVV